MRIFRVWGFLKMGVPCWGPRSKDYSIWGSILWIAPLGGARLPPSMVGRESMRYGDSPVTYTNGILQLMLKHLHDPKYLMAQQLRIPSYYNHSVYLITPVRTVKTKVSLYAFLPGFGTLKSKVGTPARLHPFFQPTLLPMQ